MQTIKQIANAYTVSDRTVRTWLKLARKDAEGEAIGSYEDGRLVFTPHEVQLLASYGRQAEPGSEPAVEVLTPELEAEMVTIEPRQQQAGPLITFNIQHVTVVNRRTDTTDLDTEADTFQAVTRNAFQGIAQHLTDDLVGMIRSAKSQNRHAVLGAQAAAGTAAVGELQQ